MSQIVKTLLFVAVGFIAGFLVHFAFASAPDAADAKTPSGQVSGDGALVPEESAILDWRKDRLTISPAKTAKAVSVVAVLGAKDFEEGSVEVADGQGFVVGRLWTRWGDRAIPCEPPGGGAVLIPGCTPVKPPVPLPLVFCVGGEDDRPRRCLRYEPVPRPDPPGGPGPR